MKLGTPQRVPLATCPPVPNATTTQQRVPLAACPPVPEATTTPQRVPLEARPPVPNATTTPTSLVRESLLAPRPQQSITPLPGREGQGGGSIPTTSNRRDVTRRVIRLTTSCLTLALLALTGCGGPQRGTMDVQSRQSFYDAALRTVKSGAYSDDPTLVMQAMEAVQVAAPDVGIPWIGDNIRTHLGNQKIENYAGITFAGLMALGTLRDNTYIEDIRTHAEDTNPNVVIAALYALDRLGDKKRTGELATFLLEHRDARVRANAALALGKLKEPSSLPLLTNAMKREKKKLPKLQIVEAMAILGNQLAVEMLLYDGNSSYPDQATLAMIFLGNAAAIEAEDLFKDRLTRAEFPEVKLAAARGLGVLGFDDGLDLACRNLWFNRPKPSQIDPPKEQIIRVRTLAAQTLEAIGSPEALDALAQAFEDPDQSPYVRLAIARAALVIMNKHQRTLRISPRTAPATKHATQTKDTPGTQAR